MTFFARAGISSAARRSRARPPPKRYAETKEQLGGMLILEAKDLNEAVELMSKHPGVRFSPFEIRPADEQMNALIAKRNQRGG